MSPIIYTPHDCEKPGYDLPAGTLYQCPECDLVWELSTDTVRDGKRLKWWAIDGPRRDFALGAARARAVQPEPPATPRVTPDIVQLVVDTYEKHNDTVTRGKKHYCKECDEHLEGSLAVWRHARTRGTWALEDAIAQAEPVPSSLTEVLDAWRAPGPNPEVHAYAQRSVNTLMPTLSAALDKACAEHPGGTQ